MVEFYGFDGGIGSGGSLNFGGLDVESGGESRELWMVRRDERTVERRSHGERMSWVNRGMNLAFLHFLPHPWFGLGGLAPPSSHSTETSLGATSSGLLRPYHVIKPS